MGETRNPSDPVSQRPETAKGLGQTPTLANRNIHFFAKGGNNDNGSSNRGDDVVEDGPGQKTARLRFHARPAGVISVEHPDGRLWKDIGAVDAPAGVAAGAVDAAGGEGEVLPSWDAVLWHGRLYVYVSARQLTQGSKVTKKKKGEGGENFFFPNYTPSRRRRLLQEAFVSLLEFAEERLSCEHVVVCLSRAAVNSGSSNNNPARGGNGGSSGGGGSSNNVNNSAVKNFLFLGFQPLAPGHEFLPPNDAKLVSVRHSVSSILEFWGRDMMVWGAYKLRNDVGGLFCFFHVRDENDLGSLNFLFWGGEKILRIGDNVAHARPWEIEHDEYSDSL